MRNAENEIDDLEKPSLFQIRMSRLIARWFYYSAWTFVVGLGIALIVTIIFGDILYVKFIWEWFNSIFKLDVPDAVKNVVKTIPGQR